MQPTAVLWDNDGVLVDTEILFFEATRAILSEVAFALTREIFVDLSMCQGRSVFELLADRFDGAAIEELRRRRNRLYNDTVARGVRINAGVQAALEQLQPQMRMGIVTGSSRDHFDTMHATTGLLRYFEFYLTHDEYSRSKPHPEPYLTALERFELDARTSIVIEDSERGLQSAVAAGLQCIVIPNDLTRGGDFSAAAAVLADAGELPEVLARL
jgi:HAD superfamily hydrolase (TIGR01509 family)